MAVPVMVLTHQTYIRSIEWGSKEALLRAALENKPNSVRVKMEVTEKLAGQGKLEDLLVHLENAIKSHPQHSVFSVQKVMFSGALGRPNTIAFHKAVDRLATAPLRTTDLIGLNELYKFRSAGRFDWPSAEQVVEMFTAAASNSNMKIRPASKAWLDRTYSQIVSELELQ